MLIPLGFLSAGGASNSFELISTITPTTTAVTFSSIPSTYRHLQLRWSGQESTSGTNFQWNLTFNGDTATNYSDNGMLSDGGGVYAGAGATKAFIYQPYQAGAGSGTVFSSGILDILEYGSTNKFKTTKSFINGWVNSSNCRVFLGSGNWRSTAAITSLTMTINNANNYVAGTRFSLYGIKG